MKILIINEQYALMGGTERALLLLSKYLERERHEVVFVHSDEPDKECKLYHSGRAYRIPELFDYRILALWRKSGWRELKTVINKENPDVIHIAIFLNYRVVKELVKLKPVIRAIHVPWTYCPGGMRYDLKHQQECRNRFGWSCVVRSITDKCAFTTNRVPFSFAGVIRRVLECYQERKINSRLEKIVANSEFTKKELINAGYHREQICVVYPPVELSNVTNPTNSTNSTNSTNFILFVGRLVLIKGIDHLIKAIKLLKVKLPLIIVGDGPERDRLEKLTLSIGVSHLVKFVGKVNTHELIRYYKTCSLIGIPSLWPEAFGLSGVEAMAYGKPVVAYNTGGINEWLIDGVTGYLVSPGDIKELADKINLVLSDPDSAKSMGRAGRERVVELFPAKKHATKMLNIYKQAVENSNKR